MTHLAESNYWRNNMKYQIEISYIYHLVGKTMLNTESIRSVRSYLDSVAEGHL